MHVSRTLSEWQARRRAMCERKIGFVPTMGALHEGHASLVRRSREENDTTVVSIFVNPTQFNNADDLAGYPRPLENDLDLLLDLGADEILVPSAQELYPNGYRFSIQAPDLTNTMEGKSRPGHFEGVMTIVMKLFHLVLADRAYFGEKDFQQLQVVTAMAKEFLIPTEVIPCPTVREKSGLAMSSRNTRLSPEARERAALIARTLLTATTAEAAAATLTSHDFTVDYVEEHWNRRLAAVFLEGVRLIDNVPLTEVPHASLP
ncbi:MAG TPA: pantoate--beta-alanine ligase [Bryobacteraceae bacterium]|jgi:pantoate--beta-alanine ligase